MFLLILTASSAARSYTLEEIQGVTCPDAELWGAKLITDVCWDCMFPMKMMGMTMGSGYVPPDAADEWWYTCTNSLGQPSLCLPVGMWMPSRMVEIVRKPYCSPVLGGSSIQDSVRMLGNRNLVGAGDDVPNVFYHYHYWSFPLAAMMDLMLDEDCMAGGFVDMDLMYLSELDPTWNDDELAFFMNPEVAIFANVAAQAVCPVDCLATSGGGNPIDSMFWCFGCWGGAYPFTGRPTPGSPPRMAATVSAKAIASLHRRGLAFRTTGEDALCGGYIYPTIPKSEYRLQQFYPVAEASNDPTDNDNNCCHKIGQSQFTWGEHRNIPAVGEDFLNIVFRWTDCCI